MYRCKNITPHIFHHVFSLFRPSDNEGVQNRHACLKAEFTPGLLTKSAFRQEFSRRCTAKRWIPARFSPAPTGEMSKVSPR